MKKKIGIFLYLFLSVAVLPNVYAQQQKSFYCPNIALTKSNGEKLFTTDGGATWRQEQKLKSSISPMNIRLQKTNGDIYLSYNGGATWWKVIDEKNKEDKNLHRGSVISMSQIGETTQVNITLFNLLGERVYEDCNVQNDEDVIISSLKSRRLPKGLYLLQIANDKIISLKKLFLTD